MSNVLSDKVLSPMNSKVKAVEEMKVPSNKQELGRFLGFINFFLHFMYYTLTNAMASFLY